MIEPDSRFGSYFTVRKKKKKKGGGGIRGRFSEIRSFSGDEHGGAVASFAEDWRAMRERTSAGLAAARAAGLASYRISGETGALTPLATQTVGQRPAAGYLITRLGD